MTGLCLIFALSYAAAPQTIELSRGKSLSDGSTYWSVSDTTLFSQAPDVNQGGLFTLNSGQGKTILIRFGDLQRAIGAHKKIVKASIVFTLVEGDKPALRSIGALKVAWGEGPIRTANVPVLKEGEKPAYPRWTATWKNRRSGENAIGWQQAGAQGTGDVTELPKIKSALLGTDAVEVGGLEAEVQRQYDHPGQCFGFALSFQDSVSFESSESDSGRPKLVLQVEDVEAVKGADLTVTRIDQTIESGQATYTAHIKNVGDATSPAFGTRWIVREVPGSLQEVGKTLKAGEETTVTFTKPHKPFVGDHRVQPIAVQIEPSAGDVNSQNNILSTYEDALTVAFVVEKSVAASLPGNVDDWIQSQIQTINETYFPYSRFSFAPDGCLERLRVSAVNIVDDGTAKDATAPGDVLVRLTPDSVKSRTFVKQVLSGLGLPNYEVMVVRNGDKVTSSEPFTRGCEDAFAGVMGGGDTRCEAMLLANLNIQAMPVIDSNLETGHVRPTDLLSATDVATLNSLIGVTQNRNGKWASALPKLIVIRAQDLTGKPVKAAELSFFQMVGGKINLDSPTLSVVTSTEGSAILTSKAPATNPFGTIEADGSNGLFLVRLKKWGVTEWAWLKAWQLADASSRGQKFTAMVDLRFNVPSDSLDSPTNLAKNRIITDSKGSLPAVLGGLVDGETTTPVALDFKEGDWVEIDLGRDRSIGEVRLFGKGDFWKRFDIMVYATGQKSDEARMWTSEADWNWTSVNRRDRAEGGFSVSYRSPSQRVRFIRLVCRIPSPQASLNEIRVTPIQVTE